jgi:hypothetical protein
MTVISAAEAAAYTDSLTCPQCKAPLEVSELSRHLAVWPGLLMGTLVVWWALRWSASAPLVGSARWALPIVCGFVAYGITSALVTMFAGDLRGREAEPATEASPTGFHGAGGHH